jgi:hypothetical protein
MTAAWYFRTMGRDEMKFDPVQREFFTTEALEGAADAIVRETIQNSLDAVQPGKKVRAQFCVSTGDAAVSYSQVEPLFKGLWPHLRCKANGLTNIPAEGDPVSFLTVEDFETHGLTGDPSQWEDAENASGKNDFYYFWRNVGRSRKGEKDRGRWGLGKTVFPAFSRIHTFFGLTIRDDDPRRLLMGQSVLMTHRIEGQVRYPYGYFGLTESDGFIKPVIDSRLVDDFLSLFNLDRGRESGLSVVIPFPHEEVTQEEIIRATVRQFFYPILSGSLVVKVGRGQNSLLIDRLSLLPMLERAEEVTRKEMLPQVDLAEWACQQSESDLIAVSEVPQDTTPKWSKELLREDVLESIRQKFERGERIAFRVPVWIRWEHGIAAKSYFDVFLKRDPALEACRPVFIREGVIISDAVRRRQHGLHALVVVEDKPLATLLGDCENPAHTEWQDRSGHFRGRYKLGPSVLRFVKNSVPELVQMLSHSQEEADPGALLDIFFLPEAADQEQARMTPAAQSRRGTDTPPSHPAVAGAKASFRIARVREGFTVRPVGDSLVLPEAIEIRVAYEVRRGNAFKRYQSADFQLDKPPIQIQAEGAAIKATGN